MVNTYEITVNTKLYYRTKSLPAENPNDCVSCVNKIESWHCNKVSSFKDELLAVKYLVVQAYQPKYGINPKDYIVEFSRFSHEGTCLECTLSIFVWN